MLSLPKGFRNLIFLEYYAVERKKEPFSTVWMELESITLHEIGQLSRDKYHMILPISGYDLTYKWNLMNKIN